MAAKPSIDDCGDGIIGALAAAVLAYGIFALLVVARLFGLIPLSWATVLAPFWVPLAFCALWTVSSGLLYLVAVVHSRINN